MKGFLVFLALVAAISAIPKATLLHDSREMERMEHAEHYPSYRVKRQNPMDPNGGAMPGMPQGAAQFKASMEGGIPGSETGSASQAPFPKPDFGGKMG